MTHRGMHNAGDCVLEERGFKQPALCAVHLAQLAVEHEDRVGVAVSLPVEPAGQRRAAEHGIGAVGQIEPRAVPAARMAGDDDATRVDGGRRVPCAGRERRDRCVHRPPAVPLPVVCAVAMRRQHPRLFHAEDPRRSRPPTATAATCFVLVCIRLRSGGRAHPREGQQDGAPAMWWWHRTAA